MQAHSQFFHNPPMIVSIVMPPHQPELCVADDRLVQQTGSSRVQLARAT